MDKDRLRHSKAGFIRYMQISRKEVFVFIEGKENDPFFYGLVCNTVCSKSKFGYEICIAQELPNSQGGKEALLKFFLYLRKKSALKTILGGKSTVSVFYLDKDIDDILRISKRSQHLIYTKYFDVQNHIYVNGDLKHGAAAAASIDPQLLSDRFEDNKQWCRNAAFRWKDWVTMCIFARERKLQSVFNYRVNSPINKPLNGPISVSKYESHLNQLKSAANLSPQDFNKAFTRTQNKVNRYYAKGEYDRLFKGKWYAVLISHDIKDLASGRHLNWYRLNSRATSAIAATLDFSASWADHFKKPLRELISKL